MANEEIQSDIPLSESEKEQLQEVVQMNPFHSFKLRVGSDR